jgi:hypothetical protein
VASEQNETVLFPQVKIVQKLGILVNVEVSISEPLKAIAPRLPLNINPPMEYLTIYAGLRIDTSVALFIQHFIV